MLRLRAPDTCRIPSKNYAFQRIIARSPTLARCVASPRKRSWTIRNPLSILEHENRAAIRALRFAAILDDRQIHAWMRIPQRHFRQRTRQRQLRARDFVTALRVGRFGGVVGDGWAAHGAVDPEESHILAESPRAHLSACSSGNSLVS